LMRGLGLFLVPTFVAFTPWTTLEGYEDLLATLIRLGLMEHVPPVQLTIRLLIPAGSRLLEVLPLHNAAIAPFQQEALSYPWANSDRRVDRLQCDLESMVQHEAKAGASRTVIFGEAWKLLQRAINEVSLRGKIRFYSAVWTVSRPLHPPFVVTRTAAGSAAGMHSYDFVLAGRWRILSSSARSDITPPGRVVARIWAWAIST
jgi:hypothetical protein